jgi:5'-nucleotidase
VDCVVVALQHIIREPVDLVISGINAGQNMGEDVLYSGTVAAALEAALNGNKAIAVSLNSYRNQNFEPSAAWIVKLLEMGLVDLCEPGMVLNINFPHLPYDEIKGIRLTQTGHRRYYNFIKITAEHEDGFSYRIGGDNPNWINLEGSDADAVKAGYISITPLGFTLTNVQCFPAVLEWLETRGLLRLEEK